MCTEQTSHAHLSVGSAECFCSVLVPFGELDLMVAELPVFVANRGWRRFTNVAKLCLGSGTGLTIVGEGVPQGDQVTGSPGAKAQRDQRRSCPNMQLHGC